MYNYKYYNSDREVIAVSTFAGKTVRGVAKCDPEDVFSLEAGKDLATARCNAKIARKRLKNAKNKLDEALSALDAAQARVRDMTSYYNDSVEAFDSAQYILEDIVNRL